MGKRGTLADEHKKEMGYCVLFSVLLLGQGRASMDVVALATPAASLLTLAWEEASPSSLKNQVRKVRAELAEIKTHLGKLEQAIIFGRDIKTIEFLIDKYTSISDIEDKEKWAETALEYGSDGFEKTINSLKEMILGTSQVFAEGSIFTTIASKDSGNICTKINLAFDYLVGLWTVSHAVWTQAYEIKKQNFNKNAIEKKTRAESAIAAFEQVKDEAIPNHCHCIEADIFYASINHLINPHETVSIGAKSATGCQGKCQADTECKAWTFYKTNLTCFKHSDDLRPLSGKTLKWH